MMTTITDKIALQHLMNSYLQETGNGCFIDVKHQTEQVRKKSQGYTVLQIPIPSMDGHVYAALEYLSQVGRHRFADVPWVEQAGESIQISPVNLAANLLENLATHRISSNPNEKLLDPSALIECWIQSRRALKVFIEHRAEQIDRVTHAQQNFISSEQALILGHSMHPSPKSRQGFVQGDLTDFSPETEHPFKMHYLYVDPEHIAFGDAHQRNIPSQFKQALSAYFNDYHQAQIKQHPDFVLMPLHPWQARYLSGQNWYQQMLHTGKLIDFGALGWAVKATTSVRTLYSEDAPWMFKTSLTVAVTNSIRVNLYKECHRGVLSYQLWHDSCLAAFRAKYPQLQSVSDPAWIALQFEGQVIDESICILRENPFKLEEDVTCIASLCQEHPFTAKNRFNEIFAEIATRTGKARSQIALDWFDQFLSLSILPLMELYHEHGMAFEAHQQNTLIELEAGMPKRVWFRDNQGFYYIRELAGEILAKFPALETEGKAVCDLALVDERFRYYFIGNTLFGLINGIGFTGAVSEQELIKVLQGYLLQALEKYPKSNLLSTVLHQSTFPYKGNLMTRLYELDELQADIAQQSIYVDLKNPLFITEKVVEADYA